MGTIIGGIAASHTPTIGFAFDRAQEDDPTWASVFAAFKPARIWLEDQKPDAIVMVYNDHVTSFFFDHYSAFALGIGERYEVADEGGGQRALASISGHGRLARHIGRSLMADEFDMSFFQDKPLDHGCFSPLSMLCASKPQWPTPIVPLQVGVLQAPTPSARRCLKLGRALRRAIESFPEDLRVVVVATGGLSHQVHGERAGFNNTAWDATLLELIEHDPELLASLTLAEYAGLGGYESAEVVMWLIMRGALSAGVRCVHKSYTLPSMTGIATLVLENQAGAPVAAERSRHRAHVAQQEDGPAAEGTYPFDVDRSVKAYRLSRFLHTLIVPAHREAFLADEPAALAAADLTDTEREMVRTRDWAALIHYGVIFFLLEKLGAVLGISNLAIYAAMRRQDLDTFLHTRNVPGMKYSVAGQASEPADA
ncbi:MAG: gallate dioxygenase [Pseudomonadota bacterium]